MVEMLVQHCCFFKAKLFQWNSQKTGTDDKRSKPKVDTNWISTSGLPPVTRFTYNRHLL